MNAIRPAFAALLALALALPVGAREIVINPSDDGSLYTCAGCNTVSNDAYLFVSDDIQGAVKFPLAKLAGGVVTKAVLTVNPYGLPVHGGPIAFYGLGSATGTIDASMANAGTLLGSMLIPAGVTYGQDIPFDVTEFVRSATTPYAGFNLRNGPGGNAVFSSIEYNLGHPAQLRVTLDDAPPPVPASSAPIPTLSEWALAGLMLLLGLMAALRLRR